MAPRSRHLLCLVAFLINITPAYGFEIVEKKDVFRTMHCPSFLVYDTAAYLSDMTIKLECHCKPDEIESVVWYYQKNLGGELSRVFTDINGGTRLDSKNLHSNTDALLRFSMQMFDLVIFKAQVKDSGHYLCGTWDKQFFYGYDIDIQESRNSYTTIENHTLHEQEDLRKRHFTVFTSFSDWSTCDRCDVKGEQRRLGLCFVQSDYLLPRYLFMAKKEAPCGSGAVPAKIKKYVADRRPELLIRRCTSPCRKTPLSFLEKIVNFIKRMIKAVKKRIPWFPKLPKVATEMYTIPEGDPLTLQCPGAKPGQAVAWDKEDEKEDYKLMLSAYLVGEYDNRRVTIDYGDHLNFRAVEKNDGGIYYCWLQGKRKAGFRLVVLGNTGGHNFNNPEAIATMFNIGRYFLGLTMLFLLLYCVSLCHYFFRCTPL
ncbi:Ig-like V-type domain-containing protein FAM187A [Pseudophryne corroboree]|uniref:Ig-like V-type domain-containing protein FAM187A n=1 Tax=Pseudophryne corroboree TaxID=495146 RepID=UPI00308137F4